MLGDIMLNKRNYIILIFLTFIFLLQIIFPNKVKANDNITLTYIYNNVENSVTVKAISEIEFKNTKPTWKLGKNKKVYIKKYNKNERYNTTFLLANGSRKVVNINVNQIDDKGPQISTKYIYDNSTDTVTVNMISNEIMLDIKPTWSLSEDKLVYTKKYNKNESYITEVKDVYGNISKVNIDVTQINGPNIEMEYVYNKQNNTVTAKMKSNKLLSHTKPTWNLSNDKLTYTKTFSKNETYYTPVQDIFGNTKMAKIEINQIDDKGPEIEVTYTYNDKSGIVTANMKSNEIMADTKPTWKLSEDKLTYTKDFNENQSYITDVKDIYGNTTKVKISITQIKKKVLNGIDISVYQGTIDWAKVSKSGVDFAMIRAGYRGYGDKGVLVEDSMFSKNVLGAKTNKIDIGIYFYTQAINVEEAKEEAKFVVNLIKKYGIDVKYPIAIDTELSPTGTGRADSISKEKRTEIVKAFCETIKQLGYKPMVYASKYWLYDNLNVQQISQYDTWLAHYTDKTDYKYSYTMWQYTSTGNVDGITGNVDKSYCYKIYN